MTKLNKKRMKWLVDQVVKHKTKISDIAQVYKVTDRRVQQLVKEYKETKKYPEPTKNRRPKTSLSKEQELCIEKVHAETNLSPKLLYYELKRQGYYAPKNKIYRFLKGKGKVRNEPNKQKKRKRCRYERKDTGALVHADYHRTSEDHPHVIFWLDDASRKILSAGEFAEETTEHAIKTFKDAQKELHDVGWMIKQVNTDRGSQFFNSTPDKNGKRQLSKFEMFLEKEKVHFIPSGRNNPQTNGKVERRWYEYDKHRWRFKTLNEWVDWYNDRLTTALDIEHYETPNKAFFSKLPSLPALFWRLMEK